mgnify:CR=1 FL=1
MWKDELLTFSFNFNEYVPIDKGVLEFHVLVESYKCRVKNGNKLSMYDMR